MKLNKLPHPDTEARDPQSARPGALSRWGTSAGEPALSRLAALVSAIVYACLGAAFLPHETIWLDETTQLNGIALGPFHVLRWLAGDGSLSNGVPMDRMPPLSYWVAQLWCMVFGGGEHSLRAMGLLCATLSVFLLAVAAGKISGWKGAAWVGAAFALNSSIVTLGVAIRVYPLLMLFASLAWYAAIQVVTELPQFRTRSLVLLGTACVLACTSHFYAVVMTGSLFAGLLLFALFLRVRPWPLVITGGLLSVPLLGLAPLIRSSAQMSQTSNLASAGSIGSVAHLLGRLIARMVVSPSVATFPALAAVVFISASVVTGSGLIRPDKRRFTLFALTVVALGLGVGSAAAIVGVGFDTLAPHYNVWLLHGAVLAGAAAFAASWGKRAALAVFAGLALVIANLAGDLRLLKNPEHFNHGPARDIETLVREADVHDLAIVHDPTAWAWSYFPLRFSYGPALVQYRISPDGQNLVGIEDESASSSLAGLSQRYVLVVSTHNLTTNDLARDLAGVPTIWEGNPAAPVLKQNPAWRLVRERRHISHIGGQAALFERVDSPTRHEIPESKPGQANE